MIGIGYCPSSHPLCKPHVCAGCDLLFCCHDTSCQPTGYYGQFHSPKCRENKLEAIQQLALPKMQAGGAALVIEPEWCYLVCRPAGTYEYRILSQEAGGYSGQLYNFCPHYAQRHVLDYRHQELTITLAIFNRQWHSLWAITGLHLHGSQVDLLGVGTPIVVIRQDE